MVGDRPPLIRAILVLLLIGGAYFALQPWVTCAFGLGWSRSWTADLPRLCTFGFGIPSFPPANWPSLVVTAIYIGAAMWVARTRRIEFATGDAPKP